MIVELIRSKRYADPFQPFAIRLKTGKRYFVTEPQFVSVWPGERIVTSDENGFAFLRPDEVDGIEDLTSVQASKRPNEVVDQIRDYRRAKPFRPFIIRTLPGESFLIPSEEYVLVHPDGNEVVVGVGRSFRFLDSRLLESAEFVDQDSPAQAS